VSNFDAIIPDRRFTHHRDFINLASHNDQHGHPWPDFSQKPLRPATGH
jgi:hypothetical protein